MTTFVLKNPDIHKNFLNFYQGLPSHKVWEIRIREYKKDLTASQRNFFHRCVDIISGYTGDEPEDVKMRLKYATLDLHEIIVGNKSYMVPVSTESLKRQEYSKLIDAVLMLGANLGLLMPTPEYYGEEI